MRITGDKYVRTIWTGDTITLDEYNEIILKPLSKYAYEEWLKQFVWSALFMGPPWQDTQ